MTIACTEISRVYNAAHYESLLELGNRVPGLKKTWLHSKKEHGRPGHVRASQQDPIPMAEPFEIHDKKSGTTEALRFPGDPAASPGNTINCGCMMKAVLPKPEELEDDGCRPLKPEDLMQPGTVWIDGVRQPPGTPSSIPATVVRNIVAPRAMAPRVPAPPAAPIAPIAPAVPLAPRVVQEPGGILPPLQPPAPPGGGLPERPGGPEGTHPATQIALWWRRPLGVVNAGAVTPAVRSALGAVDAQAWLTPYFRKKQYKHGLDVATYAALPSYLQLAAVTLDDAEGGAILVVPDGAHVWLVVVRPDSQGRILVRSVHRRRRRQLGRLHRYRVIEGDWAQLE